MSKVGRIDEHHFHQLDDFPVVGTVFHHEMGSEIQAIWKAQGTSGDHRLP